MTWGKNNEAIKALEEELLKLQQGTNASNISEREASVHKELDGLVLKEEQVWRQKSIEAWLKEGDANTRFFHTATIIRWKRNYIGRMKRDDGRCLNSRRHIGNLLNHKFGELFQSSRLTFAGDLDGLILPAVDEHNNKRLEQIPTEEEVKKTVWAMSALKAPGPDGLQGVIYKKYWDIVGPLMVKFVQEFFNGKRLEPEVCFAHVVLIPKFNGGGNVR